jgi:hypothetical protein
LLLLLEQQKQEMLNQFEVQIKQIGVEIAKQQNTAAEIDVQTALAKLEAARNPPKKAE